MRTFQRKNQIIIIISVFIVIILGQEAFAEGGFISGKVTRSDGKTPIAGAKVRAYHAGPDYQEGYYGSATTKSKGEYIIKDIVSGQYTVVATLSDYVDSTKRNISVSGNKVTENINFILFEEAIISGKVTELDGITPIINVEISIDGSDKIPKGAVDTDEEGKYQIDQILPDKYWIRAKKDDYVMQVTLPTNIEAGQKINNLNFQLERAASMSGKVMIEDTTIPVENAMIFSVSENRVYDYGTTNENGNYLLQGLASGPYQFIIRHEDYSPFLYEMDITTGETITNKNFYIQPAK